jgi:arylsulfatase A-like enzyme
MNRREFLRLSGVAAASSVFSSFLTGCHGVALSEGQSVRPNILFIMGDDHTAQAISCYGSILAPYANTKNIDRLAAEGARLENCFCTNSICAPSRATILTGQYSHINGVYTLLDSFEPQRKTFPTLLQNAGYQTALFGKWHLGTTPQGFDDYAIIEGQGRYRNPILYMKDKGKPQVFNGHSTDVLTDLTIDWMKKADRSKPFCLLCHYKATHDPWDSPDRFKQLYEDVEIPEPENLLDDYSDRSEAAARTTLKLEMLDQKTYPHEVPKDASLAEIRKVVYQQYIKDFLRCGAGIDENVGRILDYLDDAGLTQNTVVIYTADQGHFLGEHGYFSKRFMYEEALRMPFLVRYPKEIRRGAVNDDITLNIDFAPFLLDYGGVTVPPDMQGRSFRANVAGRTPPDWRKSMYYRYWMHMMHRNVAAHYGVRTHRYKLIFYYGLGLGRPGTLEETTKPEWELFDLEKDPHEMHNVYLDPGYAEVGEVLKTELLRLKRSYGDTDEEYQQIKEVQQKHWN